MSLYETVCVIKPDIQGEALKKIISKVEKVLKEHSVKKIEQNDWGIRKLAYPIQKLKTANYIQFVFEGGGAVVSELERQLNYEDHILRYLTMKVRKDVDPSGKPDDYQFGRADSFAARRGPRGDRPSYRGKSEGFRRDARPEGEKDDE